jgi:hypothetical protein
MKDRRQSAQARSLYNLLPASLRCVALMRVSIICVGSCGCSPTVVNETASGLTLRLGGRAVGRWRACRSASPLASQGR